MNDKLYGVRRMIPEAPGHVLIIDNDAALAEFASCLAGCEWLAMDTEFVRERTYHPQLGLVQIANSKCIGLVDVLALTDTTPLVKLLTDENIQKVFHAAEQDLEVLHHTFGHLPAPLFDTQIAAPLLGLDTQIGYARLIETLLDKKLPKSHTRTNWCKRPLSQGALSYAADDVRYLAVIYPALRAALEETGRLDWLIEDCERLARPGRFRVDTTQAWRRIRHWYALPPAAQQILAELADWRERAALSADRPRRWILADDILRAIAEKQPTNDLELADTPGLPAKTLERHATALLGCVERGLQRPATMLDANAGPPDTPPTRRRIKTGMRALSQAAEAADVPAAAIASRAEIAAIVAGKRDGRLLQGWRAAIAGQAVVAAVESAQSQASNPDSEG